MSISKERAFAFVAVVILTASPLAAWSQALYMGTPQAVNLANTGLPTYTVNGVLTADYPDGHLPVVWDANNGYSQIIWAENQSWANYGSSIAASSGAFTVLGAPPVSGTWGSGATSSGDRSHPTYFDNSGSWLLSAFRVDQGTFNLDPSSQYMIGFYHGEDHWFTDAGTSNSYYHDPVAWIGVGLATSTNGGSSWTKGGMVVGVPDLKPQYPSPYTATESNAPWGGIANHCVVLDSHSNPDTPAWVLFFPMITSVGLNAGHGIAAIRTTDPNAARANWYSYYNGSFGTQQESNEGLNSSLPGLDGNAGNDFNHYALSNPSVTWSTTLNKWVLVAATWDRTKLMVSYSTTSSIAGGWTEPAEFYYPPSGSTVTYPTLVGTDHRGQLNDTETGTNATVYWAQFSSSGVRSMMSASVTIQ